VFNETCEGRDGLYYSYASGFTHSALSNFSCTNP